MDDLEREKKEGFDWEYMMDAVAQKEKIKELQTQNTVGGAA